MINDWYMTDDYHRDNGEGGDLYSVGKSRGCGGIAVWTGRQAAGGNGETAVDGAAAVEGLSIGQGERAAGQPRTSSIAPLAMVTVGVCAICSRWRPPVSTCRR